MLKNFMQNDSSATTNPPPRPDASKSQQPYGSTSKVFETPRTDTPPPPVAEPVVATNDNGSKLIVGPNIKLKGSEITDCEILVVEGRVEASMNSRDIRIAEGGVFSGKAEIDVAEVRGNFEGDLTARKRLVIYSTGKVSGTIRYGALMVEEGGTLSGDVATLGGASIAVKTGETSAQTKLAELVHEQDTEIEQLQFGSARSLTGKR
jgi:cytoskeletal protein CcmA (bactofilin family)